MKKMLVIVAWLLSWSIIKAQNVVRAEYFIDADRGFGNNTPVVFNSPLPDGTYSFTINVTGVPVGYHKLYVRTKDSDNNWSHTVRRNLEVINGNIDVIKEVEYFFNSDPGVGNAALAVADAPSTGGTFNFTIPLDKIPVGAHILYLRATDSVNKNRSITQFQKDSVITTMQTGMWSNPATWSSNRLPDSNTVIIMMHTVTVDIDGNCKSIALYHDNANLIVNTGKKLTIKGRRRY